jgi:hypothetical protein
MRSIVLVQQGLRDNVRAIIQCDAISCVEIDGLRSESPLTPGEAPLAIVTRKPARGKSVPLPHHLSRLPRLDFDPDDTSKLAANIIDLLSARLKRAEAVSKLVGSVCLMVIFHSAPHSGVRSSFTRMAA